ncbi:bifunctional molybdenum cofactor biosynthesis protein [Trichoderma barbatum]
MTAERGSFKPLILAGGKSSRLGKPKHLLRTPRGKTLIQQCFDLLKAVYPAAPKIYISVAQETDITSFLDSNFGVAEPIFDAEPNPTLASAGPAAGLLSAYDSDPNATWLVLACDYPLITVSALGQLCREYSPPATCFSNAKGFHEPLIGIWNPEALACLAENVSNGVNGPTSTLKELRCLTISPPACCEHWLFNVNTMTDWNHALEWMMER